MAARTTRRRTSKPGRIASRSTYARIDSCSASAPASVRAERDALDAKLLGELPPSERRLQELEAAAAANGWAVDRKAMIYLHVLPPGHVHTRLTEDVRVYDAGCDGCTRYHRLNRDGRMIAPEITREEAAAVLGARERPSGEGTA